MYILMKYANVCYFCVICWCFSSILYYNIYVIWCRDIMLFGL